MKYLLSYCGLFHAKIRASDKDLPVSLDFSSTISLVLALVLKAGPRLDLSVFQGFAISSGLESSILDLCKIVILLGSGIGGLVVLGIICPFLDFEIKSPMLFLRLDWIGGSSSPFLESSPFFEAFFRISA